MAPPVGVGGLPNVPCFITPSEGSVQSTEMESC